MPLRFSTHLPNCLQLLRSISAIHSSVLAFSFVILQTSASAENQFLTQGPGLALLETEYQSASSSIPLQIVRIDPAILSPIVRSSKEHRKIKLMAQELNAAVGINTNFFDPTGRPLGLIISEGETLRAVHHGGSLLTGIFSLSTRGIEIVGREFPPAAPKEAFQAGPLLIEKGTRTVLKERGEGTRRGAIAVNREGLVLLVVTKNRFPGMTLTELQDFLATPSFRIISALNLDGGGSSQLFVRLPNNSEEIDISGGDPVPVGLFFKKK